MKKKAKALEFRSEIRLHDKPVPAASSREQPPAAEETREPVRGLECRACGCRHFEVVYTRPAYGGRILRSRACRHCGKRIQTYEIPVKERKGQDL